MKVPASEENKVINKIRKLITKAKDPACSENEVEIFMQKAQELMLKNNIQKGDIEINLSDINKDVVFSDLWKHFKYKYKNFEWELIDTIAHYYNCKIFQGISYDFEKYPSKWKETKKVRLSIVGTLENRMIVSEMYEFLVHKFLTLGPIRYKEYQNQTKEKYAADLKSFGLNPNDLKVQTLEAMGLLTRKNTFICSYLSGCISGLGRALASQRQQSLRIEGGETWGLIVKRNDELIKLAVPKLMGKINTVDGIGSKAKFSSEGYIEGIKDGESNHTNKILNK